MKFGIYLETTIFSYLTARPSRDLIQAAHQQVTGEWWQTRDRFDLYVSDLVIQESGKGDETAARQRLEVLAQIPVLEFSANVQELARHLIEHGPIPEKAVVDALHIAFAAVHGMDYLLTWNCTHIANAAMRNQIESLCRAQGYEPPIICTPEELLEETDHA